MNDIVDSAGAASPDRSSEETEAEHVRILAVKAAARFHGVDLDTETLTLDPKDPAPSSPHLVEWLRESGLWAR
nr:hypothetical protein [Acidiphilium sp. 34-64-41]